MRPEEKQQLHEPDGFMKASGKVYERLASMSRAAKTTLWAVLIALVLIAAAAAINEFAQSHRRDITDTAGTVPEMEAAAKTSNDAQLLLRLGAAYVSENTPESAAKGEAVLARALDSADNDFERGMVTLQLAKAKLELKKYDEAAKLFRSAAENSETRYLIVDEANWYAGRCFELLNQPEAALEQYSKVGISNAGLWKSLADYRRRMMRQESVQ